MRTLRIALIVLCVMALAASAVGAAPPVKPDLGREVLAENDGWASEGAGTTGGSTADADHVYTVTDRAGLVAALNNASATPKIIYVQGAIDVNVDDNNEPLTCQDYYRNGYTLEAFLAAYDPAVWGKVPPSGDLENARIASREAQKARIQIPVGSNTTIVGLGNDAHLLGVQLDLRGTWTAPRSNIIIRNIAFQDTFDCFPAWSPTDGGVGAWNAEYDSIAVRYTNHVWIDHNSFADVATIDSREPMYFGVHYERHDGLTDITNASDFVTVSWNQYRNHDKVMLIGSSDTGTTATRDRGRLNVTIHHNLFDGLGQRTPRVRFGKVHVYNNYYKLVNIPKYGYSWGVGLESAIYAENNYFQTDQSIMPNQIIAVYKGTMIQAAGTRFNGTPGGGFTDVVAAFNEANDPDLLTDVGWEPEDYYEATIDGTQRVVPAVHSGAGPFNW